VFSAIWVVEFSTGSFDVSASYLGCSLACLAIDTSKVSKKGRLKLVRNEDGTFATVTPCAAGADLMKTVFTNGVVVKECTLDDIRARALV
jgi:hypothetical protein